MRVGIRENLFIGGRETSPREFLAFPPGNTVRAGAPGRISREAVDQENGFVDHRPVAGICQLYAVPPRFIPMAAPLAELILRV